MGSTTSYLSANNMTMPVSLGVGLGIGVAVYLAYRARRRRVRFVGRTLKQAVGLARQAVDMGCAAVQLLEKGREEIDRQKKGLVDAVEAGKAAYTRSVA